MPRIKPFKDAGSNSLFSRRVQLEPDISNSMSLKKYINFVRDGQTSERWG